MVSMMILYIIGLAACVNPISAGPNITVTARVGSLAVLPCKLTPVSSQTPNLRWRTDYDIIFERSSNSTSTHPRFRGRVDVPVDRLRKGDCSLVLKDVRLSDDSVYKSYIVEQADSANPIQWNEINRVRLTVDVVKTVSARVGSTVLLPCEWKDLNISSPHIQWTTEDEVVFERMGKESEMGPGYEGRADVPLDELIKGNCSLVLKNVSNTDAAVYRSGMIVKQISETLLVQKVKLSISNEAGINCLHLFIPIVSLLMHLLLLH